MNRNTGEIFAQKPNFADQISLISILDGFLVNICPQILCVMSILE
ncbi:hypothetical protein [Nostoc sp. LEGE 06077]|nr:hypothetical protein [Nostoc sp. LEGE 06077]